MNDMQMENGHIERLHTQQFGGKSSSDRDELLEFYSDPATGGSTCSLLTPAIKVKLREMLSGQVLEIRVDDRSAREDIESWCRLSGNVLLKTSDGEGPELRFFVQKK
jgi:TusA-related sulfurtransferase